MHSAVGRGSFPARECTCPFTRLNAKVVAFARTRPAALQGVLRVLAAGSTRSTKSRFAVSGFDRTALHTAPMLVFVSLACKRAALMRYSISVKGVQRCCLSAAWKFEKFVSQLEAENRNALQQSVPVKTTIKMSSLTPPGTCPPDGVGLVPGTTVC